MENTNQLVRITELQTELAAAKQAKAQADGQITIFKDVYGKLEDQLRQTFEAKMELKAKEVQDLSGNLAEKVSKINELNGQIKQLQRKVEAMSSKQ